MGRTVVKDGEAKAFNKVFSFPNVWDVGVLINFNRTVVSRVNDFRFNIIYFLVRTIFKVFKNLKHGSTIIRISLGKEGVIINKEHVRDFKPIGGYLDRDPRFLDNFFIDVFSKSLHIEDEVVG